jgi:hypothetical protein
MLHAVFLLCVMALTGCAKAPGPLVELRAHTDPLSLYCRSGHLSASANRALDVVGCGAPAHEAVLWTR